MKTSTSFPKQRALVVALTALMLACSSGPSIDQSIKNETTKAAVEEESKKQEEQLEALKESLPKEQVKEIERKNAERDKKNDEVRAASPNKAKSDGELEAMLEEWMASYEESGSTEHQVRIRDGLGKDPVLRDWGRKYPEKYKALQERYKAVVERRAAE